MKKFLAIPVLLGALVIAAPASAYQSPLSMSQAHARASLLARAEWNAPSWSEAYGLAWHLKHNDCQRFSAFRIDCVVDVTQSGYAYDYEYDYSYGYAYCVGTVKVVKDRYGVVRATSIGRPQCDASA